MSLTRRQLIEAAFGELGITNQFDVSPDELVQAIGKLNRMMSTWDARNLRVGYSPGTDIEGQTGIIDSASEAVTLILAIRLAPSVGKVPGSDLKRDARAAYLALLTQRVRLIPVQLPAEMPSGAGNRRFHDRNYVAPPSVPAEIGSGGVLDEVDFE